MDCPCPTIDVHSDDSSFDFVNCDCSDDKGFDPSIYHDITVTTNSDYNKLKNKPKINSVVLDGDVPLTDLSLRHIYYGTTEYWNSQLELVSEEGAIYVYSDYSEKDVDGKLVDVPAIKIGDGLAFVVDLPVVGSAAVDIPMDEIRDYVIATLSANQSLVSPTDRVNWDGKTSVAISAQDAENLIFTVTH